MAVPDGQGSPAQAPPLLEFILEHMALKALLCFEKSNCTGFQGTSVSVPLCLSSGPGVLGHAPHPALHPHSGQPDVCFPSCPSTQPRAGQWMVGAQDTPLPPTSLLGPVALGNLCAFDFHTDTHTQNVSLLNEKGEFS